MLILNESDMKKTLNYKQVMDKVEDAYRIFQSGVCYMPDRQVLTHEKNMFLFMPSFMKSGFGTKFLTFFPENPSKGHPLIDGLMLLNDPENGKTVAILDARYLTALRTGAVGGVGVRNFSRADCKSVGIIGAGQQGFFQAIYATQARDIKDIYFFDTAVRNFDEYTARLKKELQTLANDVPAIHVCGTVEQLLEKSEIVITATPSASPVVPDDVKLLRGKCFIAIGSYKPTTRELPNAIWKLIDHVYTELPYAVEESGDLSQPLEDGLLRMEQVKFIGDWLMQEHRPLPQSGETSYFKSVGMGLLDLNVSQMIYNEALKMGVGQTVEF